ncbi:hypothetical protein L207DRAFT_628262 [Hyaloscypha variabilis F]|uniref:Uncharacterized protein n=1 Tax=Hyaloscypha variabilis (strain UAMH 11265 / GT02V1 / F) TaxID=1149755 RepID=A0A2J6SA68_HYAVF|nr:hypothetical protein L207DRAFT_628262 [Hyaloscypha variabilis F]
MRRSQKLKEGEQCLGCLMRHDSNELCYWGTTSGDCGPCGRSKLKSVDFSFEGFYGDDLKECLLSLADTPEYGSLDSNENTVEIDVGLPNGIPDCIPECKLRKWDHALKKQIDKMVIKFCFPNAVSKTAITSFMTSAWLGRGYLALLFPCHVVQEAQSFTNSIRLFNLIFTRLDEIISEVVNGFKKEKELGDERYWSELSVSLAILYFGLLHAQGGFKDHPDRPICGDSNLPRLLAHRIKLTLEYLDLLLGHQGLSCDPRWLKAFAGTLEDLQSSVKISSLNIRTITSAGLMRSARSLSASSHGSTSIGTSNTPPSSIEATPPGDPGIIDTHDFFKTGWGDASPESLVTPSLTKVAPSLNQFLFGQLAPPPTVSWRPDQGPLLSTFMYDNPFSMLVPLQLPAYYTPYFNGFSGPPLEPFPQDTGFGDTVSQESFSEWQPLGNSSNLPSEIEQDHHHVSLHWPYMYDLGEETSVMDPCDLSSASHYPHTFIE